MSLYAREAELRVLVDHHHVRAFTSTPTALVTIIFDHVQYAVYAGGRVIDNSPTESNRESKAFLLHNESASFKLKQAKH